MHPLFSHSATIIGQLQLSLQLRNYLMFPSTQQHVAPVQWERSQSCLVAGTMPVTPPESYKWAESPRKSPEKMWEQCPSFLFFLPCLCFPLLFCSCLLPSDFKLYHCLLLHQSLFPLISIFSRTCSLRSHLPEPVLIVSSSLTSAYISSVQLLSHVWLFAAPWTVAHQASLSITNSRSLLKLMSIEL